MLKVARDKEDIIIRFSKNLLSPEEVERFIGRLEWEELARQNKMTEEDAWEISEQIKADWWDKNKDRFLKKNK